MSEPRAVKSDIGPYSLVPEWLLDGGVSARAVCLYALLGRFADREGESWPSRAKLASRLRCSTDTVDRLTKGNSCRSVRST